MGHDASDVAARAHDLRDRPDHVIAVEPDADLVTGLLNHRKAAESGGDALGIGSRAARAIGQIPICWNPDAEELRAAP